MMKCTPGAPQGTGVCDLAVWADLAAWQGCFLHSCMVGDADQSAATAAGLPAPSLPHCPAPHWCPCRCCRMLAELLIRMVQATAAGLTIQPLSSREAAGLQGERQQEEQLLPPMTPNNYETNTSSCWLGVRVQRTAAGAISAVAACVALQVSMDGASSRGAAGAAALY